MKKRSKHKSFTKEEWKMFEEGMAVGKSFEHLKFTGKPTCISCGKEFKKLTEYAFEPNCEHGRGKWLLSIGRK